MSAARRLPRLDELPDFSGEDIQLVGTLPVPPEWQDEIERVAQERARRGREGNYRVQKARDEDRQLCHDRKGAAAEFVVKQLVECWGVIHDLPVISAPLVADAPVREGDIGIGHHLFDVKGASGRVSGLQEREDRFVTVNCHQNDVLYPAKGIEGYFVGRLAEGEENLLADVFYVPRKAVSKCTRRAGTREGAGDYYEVPLPPLSGEL